MKSIDDADKYFLELTTQALKQIHLDIISLLVGKSILGNKLMKVPSKGYDSTTDNNQIFVVYHDAQAYTNYLIKYQ
ncbi:unnamed protein product [Rotaria sordida]|uniref:Uncharacterized protein n=1 Tax=Rotaria sordida TaxID=392033 RepID=A0A818LST2_9BILA|nr:unnamed protein product [Rotaria sordida]